MERPRRGVRRRRLRGRERQLPRVARLRPGLASRAARPLGFIELEDIAAIRSRLESDGVVDPERVSVVGISWGGYLTLMAVGTEPDRWRSGAAMVPVADFRVMAHDAPSFMGVYIDVPPPWESPTTYPTLRAASPSTTSTKSSRRST